MSTQNAKRTDQVQVRAPEHVSHRSPFSQRKQQQIPATLTVQVGAQVSVCGGRQHEESQEEGLEVAKAQGEHRMEEQRKDVVAESVAKLHHGDPGK